MNQNRLKQESRFPFDRNGSCVRVSVERNVYSLSPYKFGSSERILSLSSYLNFMIISLSVRNFLLFVRCDMKQPVINVGRFKL